MKQVNEIQPTKVAVVFEVNLSDFKKPSSWSKAAYWGLELFLGKGVQNKIHPSAICLWHNELLERGVSRVANVAVGQLKQLNNLNIECNNQMIIQANFVNFGYNSRQYTFLETAYWCNHS